MTAHDLFIIKQQKLPYTYIDNIKEVACSLDECFGVFAVFAYGVMEGKRAERAKYKKRR